MPDRAKTSASPASNSYFQKFDDFEHQDGISLIENFNALSLKHNWKKGSKAYQKHKSECYSAALAATYGAAGRLQGWQELCADLQVEPVPSSIRQCKLALARVHVNIYDFIDARSKGQAVKKFKSVHALQNYSVTQGKIFPRKLAKEDGYLKVLLRKIL